MIGCIGAGYWGRNLVRNFDALKALSWVCDADRARRDELAAAYPRARVTDSVDQVLSDPGVTGVAIATPAETHGELARRALLAGKDVFVEKPLCLSAEEGRGPRDARRRTTAACSWSAICSGITRRSSSLKRLVDDGELGRIQYIYSNRLNLGKIRTRREHPLVVSPRTTSPSSSGCRARCRTRSDAQGGNYLNDRIADVTVSLLSFPSGVKAHIFVSWLHPFKEQKLVVVGDRKMAVFNDIEPRSKLVLYPHSRSTGRSTCRVASKARRSHRSRDGGAAAARSARTFSTASDAPTPADRRPGRACGSSGCSSDCQQALEHGPDSARPQAKARPPKPPYFVHESAFVDSGVQIGEGTTIWHVSHVLKNSRIGKQCRIGQNVVIGPNVVIGNGVKIQNNVSVYEGVTLEDDVFCGPSMVFTNVINPRSEIARMHELRPTLVRRGATLGANCTVVCGYHDREVRVSSAPARLS